jgi:hypothetical protein
MAQKTYGDFIDSVEETEIAEAAIFIEQWKKTATEEQWKEYRQMPLTLELILSFAEDAATHFRRRIAGIEIKELYKTVIEDAHAFLREVYEEAKQLGIQIELAKIDTFLTPSEVIAGEGGQQND